MSFSTTDYRVTLRGKPILKGLNVHVAAGHTLALLGANGAGKSTFMKGLCGLVPALGFASINGTALLGMSPATRARMIGYVAQDLAHLDVRLSTYELLLLAQQGSARSWKTSAEARYKAAELLEQLGLQRFAESQPGRLSGGERQMISLALALVRSPQLLLLDEPTSALDLANQLQILDAVSDYTRTHNIVTLAIFHDMNLASRYADDTLMLDQGIVHCCGPTRTTLTPDNLAQVYGVDCRALSVDAGAFTAIYPVSVIAPGRQAGGR
ncbi:MULTISPECIES: ABC transporter ATP-binding protein [Pseudomonas syringae group]|uniref:ABC transporter ATP-binding protein n=1 Tax=Pseudomonas syringae group TaxID=136849 RepID=UPI0006ABE65C|nr:ABC transporter ATP-binding protein [Pseudomonas coronafaciens]RMW02524.1 ABC transporter related protein [Pseudomonas coronafaciens pv. porri]